MKKINHYNIIDRIGIGGMGEVYRAEDTVLERCVAIKIMHHHLSQDSENVDRLIREAKAAAKLVHPNVITIHEIGEADFGYYIVMEYINGISLSDFLYHNDKIDQERAVNFTIQILKALNAAHKAGILHRDIKAENILITEDDQVKVLDFGIARVSKNDDLTKNNEILGTIDYMAPEQMLGDDIDERCDLYAAGMVLYQLLTRLLPFKSSNTVQILFNKLNEEPASPSSINPRINRELDAIVLKAIHKKPSERWQTAEEFLTVLRDFLDQLRRDKIKPAAVPINYDLDFEEDGKNALTLKNVFIGRQKEFKRLVQLFNDVKIGRGQSVIIKGEAGIGKSRLASKFRSYAEYNKACVIYGACLYKEGMDAYLPFIDGLRDFFSRDNQRLTENDRNELVSRVRKQMPDFSLFMDRFTTTLVQKSKNKKGSTKKSQDSQLENFIHLFSLISNLHPLILIIDDMQWADVASLRLFHYLSKRISKHRILLIGISRTDRYDLQDDGKPTYWVDTLKRMSREDLLNTIDLDYLSKEDSNQLIDQSLENTAFSEEFYVGLYEATRGNPFFILETLKSLQANERIIQKNTRWIDLDVDFKLDVPERVEDIFIRRLSCINERERELLQVASVIGYKFDPVLLSYITELKKIEVLKILGRMEKSYEIVQGSDRDYKFEHPLLADLLYQEMPKAMVKEYHLMIAEQMGKIFKDDFGSFVGDVAEHYRKGQNYAKAIPLLYNAGVRSFDMSAYREASLYYENLIQCMQIENFDDDAVIPKIELYFQLGICYEETGKWELGIETYDKLSQLAINARNFSRYVNAIMRIGRIYDKLGNWSEAMQYYDRCLELADIYDIDDVKSRIYNNIGINCFHKGDFDSALDYFQETLAVSKSENALFDKAHAYTNIGIIANILHGPDSVALENFNRALAIYKAKQSKANIARVYQNMGMIYSDKKDWANAVQFFEKCLDIAEETQEKQLRVLTYLNLGKTYALQGTILKAKTFSDKALKMFKRMNDVLGIAEAYHVLGIIYSHENDFERAEKFLSESIKINKEKDYKEGLAETYVTYAKLYLKNGLIDLAKENYMRAVNIYQAINIDVKVKEIQSLMDQLLSLETSGITHSKVLTQKYGKTVRHS
ncbi:MAG: tetratricopeptide repeat protein [Calditrichaceae bacterium]|nr:tetratricopeptide repeat protein [Calditrichaceae bacterium]